jgi:hypothetical protein
VSTLSGYGMGVLDAAIHPGGTVLATACARLNPLPRRQGAQSRGSSSKQ